MMPRTILKLASATRLKYLLAAPRDFNPCANALDAPPASASLIRHPSRIPGAWSGEH